jgi:hypothetical protein
MRDGPHTPNPESPPPARSPLAGSPAGQQRASSRAILITMSAFSICGAHSSYGSSALARDSALLRLDTPGRSSLVALAC